MKLLTSAVSCQVRQLLGSVATPDQPICDEASFVPSSSKATDRPRVGFLTALLSAFAGVAW